MHSKDYQDYELGLARRYGEEAVKQIAETDEDAIYVRIAATLAAGHAMNGLRLRELKFPIRVGGNDGHR